MQSDDTIDTNTSVPATDPVINTPPPLGSGDSTPEASFEEQFRSGILASLPATQPAASAAPAFEFSGKKSLYLRLPLWISLAVFALLVGVGVVLMFTGDRNAPTISEREAAIADLSSQAAVLREAEDQALENTGFSKSFYSALKNTSDVVDNIYAQEDALAESGSRLLNPWERLVRSGTILCFGIALSILCAGIAIFFILSRNAAAAGFVGAAMCIGCLLIGCSTTRAENLGSGGAIQSISLAEFAADTDYVEKLVPGSDNDSDWNYYASPDFQSTPESHALFGVDDDGDGVADFPIEIYDGEVGFSCNILGVRNYMVDFTYTDKHFTNVVRSSPVDTTQPDIRTRAEKAAMIQNTLYLQLVEYCAANSGITITIPKGEYYFAIGHTRSSGETMVIVPVNNVNISGRGIGDYQSAIATALRDSNIDAIDRASSTTTGANATILRPYTQASYNSSAAPDMFRFNDYADSEYENPGILKNISYRSLIVDGADAVGKGYTSAGKGFMYNLFENVNWDNVVVQNTDGTGFGVDCPLGSMSYIKNSLAINNGKKANSDNGGASGFGIGMGYRDDERFSISNSVSYGNTKFGFFYEHQNRFQSPTQENYPYDAIAGAGNVPLIEGGLEQTSLSRDAFTVSNSLSADNLYNYGGERAHDMRVVDSASIAGSVVRNQGTYYAQTTTTSSDIYYSADSRRVEVDDVRIIGGMPSDVQDQSLWYYTAVRWALENGITYGVSRDLFGVGQQLPRKDALMLIWRMMGQPGDVITKRNDTQSDAAKKTKIATCFDDVAPDNPYAGAVKWAYDDRYDPTSSARAKGRIIVGKVACDGASGGEFDMGGIVTRAEFVTMLWRLEGEPQVSRPSGFNDVLEDAWYATAANWAVANGITNGVGENQFAPASDCTREQAITFLYRYNEKFGR